LIANASPLIIFGKLNRMDILKEIYGHIEISEGVHNEVVVNGIKRNAGDALLIKEAIGTIIKVMDLNAHSKDIAKKIQNAYGIDTGEAETIALVLQLHVKYTLIDEAAAREAAKGFGIKPVGSLRVLLIAYKKRIITKEEIKSLIQEMEISKYRFSPQALIEFWNLFDKIAEIE